MPNKKKAEGCFEEVAEAQGWNDTSMLAVLRGFIFSVHMDDELDEYARQQADEENEASDANR